MLVILSVLISCSYSVHQNAYPHLETITIDTFSNSSTQYTLEEEVLASLTANFQSDNLLSIVEINPDCQLTGKMKDYVKKIHDYDESGQVSTYQLKILFQIRMTDLVRNEVLYEDEKLLLTKIYAVPEQSDNPSLPQSEEEARDEILNDLYDRIMEQTFQSW